ncbi:MAG: hypothetical protein HFE86_07255 [Clostridiales bacterium]|nr:hypothetical protein [Clostridiales bacterium]
MKRNLLLFALAALLSLSLAACGNSSGQTAQTALDGRSPADYSVRLADPVLLDGKQVEPTYSVAEPVCAYTQFSDYQGKTASVVRGKVKTVEYFTRDRSAFTKMDLEITENISGDFIAGDIISVFKWGGYAPLSVTNPDIQERFPEITDEELANTVVDMRIDGDPHPITDQDIVVCLREQDQSNENVSGMYPIVGGYYGQFTNDGSGTFTRHVEYVPEGREAVGFSLAPHEIDRSNMTGTHKAFTFDQLKSELQTAIS